MTKSRQLKTPVTVHIDFTNRTLRQHSPSQFKQWIIQYQNWSYRSWTIFKKAINKTKYDETSTCKIHKGNLSIQLFLLCNTIANSVWHIKVISILSYFYCAILVQILSDTQRWSLYRAILTCNTIAESICNTCVLCRDHQTVFCHAVTSPFKLPRIKVHKQILISSQTVSSGGNV